MESCLCFGRLTYSRVNFVERAPKYLPLTSNRCSSSTQRENHLKCSQILFFHPKEPHTEPKTNKKREQITPYGFLGSTLIDWAIFVFVRKPTEQCFLQSVCLKQLLPDADRQFGMLCCQRYQFVLFSHTTFFYNTSVPRKTTKQNRKQENSSKKIRLLVNEKSLTDIISTTRNFTPFCSSFVGKIYDNFVIEVGWDFAFTEKRREQNRDCIWNVGSNLVTLKSSIFTKRFHDFRRFHGRWYYFSIGLNCLWYSVFDLIFEVSLNVNDCLQVHIRVYFSSPFDRFISLVWFPCRSSVFSVIAFDVRLLCSVFFCEISIVFYVPPSICHFSLVFFCVSFCVCVFYFLALHLFTVFSCCWYFFVLIFTIARRFDRTIVPNTIIMNTE